MQKNNIFQFLQATPSSADFIIDGLKKIDGMLKEEVDDPYAWGVWHKCTSETLYCAKHNGQ